MKIIFLNKYQDKVFRGAETYVHELARRLSKVHDVEIISDINYFSLLKKDFDLVIPTNGRAQAMLTKLICLLRGKKMIISGQSGAGFDDRINLYAFPNVFVALSTKALTWAKKTNPFIRSVCIPNGADIKKFTPADKKNSKIKTVIAVGAFTKEKGHDKTINAMSKVSNVKLLILGGGGDLKEEITKLGNKLLKGRFEILSVSRDKMPSMYKKADLFVFPTVPWESFGIVLVEAMASGLPVVATDDPIRREIVGDAGYFVDPSDTDSYAKAITKALNTNWGDKPVKQARHFSWDAIADKYIKLISSL